MSDAVQKRREYVDTEDVARYLAMSHDIDFDRCQYEYKGWSDEFDRGTLTLKAEPVEGVCRDKFEFTGMVLESAIEKHLVECEGWTIRDVYALDHLSKTEGKRDAEHRFMIDWAEKVTDIDDEEQREQATRNRLQYDHWRRERWDEKRETIVVRLDRGLPVKADPPEDEPDDDLGPFRSWLNGPGRSARIAHRIIALGVFWSVVGWAGMVVVRKPFREVVAILALVPLLISLFYVEDNDGRWW